MKETNNHATILLAIIAHILIVATLYILLKETGLIANYPTNNNLIHNDAIWYIRIVENGYNYIEGEMNTMAFFPLFAYTWKLTGLNAVGISIFNSITYLLGLYLIARHLKLDFPGTLIALSTPSLFFCSIPYTEAFFFLGTTLILIGINSKKAAILCFGTFIAGLTRSVGIVFFPAFIFTLLVHWKKNDRKANIKNLIITGWCCLILIITTWLVIFLQYIQTGEWFVFFEVQKSWNRTLNIPRLPFTTMSGINMLWLDGLALFVAIVSFYICSTTIFNFIVKRESSYRQPGTDISLAYLVMMGFICTFFSGSWDNGLGTSLMSINRYIFTVPFFLVFLNRLVFSNDPPFDRTNKCWMPVLVIVTWLLLGAFTKLNGYASYWQTALYFCCMTLYILLYVAVKRYKKAYIILYLVNVCIQIYLFDTYIAGKWVG